jgi:hypothetical protein
MVNLSEKVLNKIKSEAIKPCPRWRFLLKNYSWWLAGVISIFVGGLSSSVVFYMLANNDWDIYRQISGNLTKFIFITLPYFWLAFLILFIILADYYLKNTKHGYRFSLVKVVAGSIILSFVLGGVFYYAGAAETIESAFSRTVPGYDKLTFGHRQIWLQPERGFLAGTITAIRDKNNFILRDFVGRSWKIKGKGALVRPRVILMNGTRIKIIGRMQAKNLFIAQEIRPWPGGFGHRRHWHNAGY